MAPRRPFSTQRSTRIGRPQRLRVPRLGARMAQLEGRDALKESAIRTDPAWWTGHRAGPRRPLIGGDPLEARAIPDSQVHGTLPERILFLALMQIVHLAFYEIDFQTSLQGGRLEVGGLAADFIIWSKRIVIRVQGPLHKLSMQIRKDEEQKGILEDMGFTVWDIEDTTIYAEMELEEWLRRHFFYGGGGGSFVSGGVEEVEDLDQEMIEEMFNIVHSMNLTLESL